jgi:hypothetical protein
MPGKFEPVAAQKKRSFLIAWLVAFWMNVTSLFDSLVSPTDATGKRSFARDTYAFVQWTWIGSLIGSILVTLLTVILLNSMSGDFFGAVADFTGTLDTTDFNSTLANAIAGIFALIFPVIALLAYLGLAFLGFEVLRRKGGKASEGGY